jgi:hypothetical protein
MSDILESKGLVVEKIDGALPENKELRDTLFGVSGKRGQYPQCFILSDGTYRFVGLWEEFESLNECEELPQEVLDANPSIQTITSVFKGCERK